MVIFRKRWVIPPNELLIVNTFKWESKLHFSLNLTTSTNKFDANSKSRRSREEERGRQGWLDANQVSSITHIYFSSKFLHRLELSAILRLNCHYKLRNPWCASCKTNISIVMGCEIHSHNKSDSTSVWRQKVLGKISQLGRSSNFSTSLTTIQV